MMEKWCLHANLFMTGERGGSVVECRTPEREVRGSRPTAAVLCPWARHFTPRKYWLITQEAMAPSRYDWKIVDLDVKPQYNQPTKNLFMFDWIIIKVAGNQERHKSSVEFDFGLNRWAQVSDRCPLGYLFLELCKCGYFKLASKISKNCFS